MESLSAVVGSVEDVNLVEGSVGGSVASVGLAESQIQEQLRLAMSITQLFY